MMKVFTHRLSTRFLAYVVSGIGAFCVEYGSFYCMYSMLHWPLYVANSISFGLGLMTSFLLNRLWTFGHKEYDKGSAHQLGYYILLALFNLLLTNVVVELLSQAGIQPKVGKLVAMVLTSAWNYAAFKLIIFTHRKSSDESGT